jgi:hypothetical protein
MGQIQSVFDCASNPLHGDEDEDGASEEFTPLEDFVPLRRSQLWSLQSRYYAHMGLRAWAEGHIPHFVASNAFVARAYARVIVAALWDAHARGGSAGLRGEPVHIVEVGAGHGKLGFLIVDCLLRFRRFLPPLGGGAPVDAPPFRYVLTDSSAGTVAAMRGHPLVGQLAAAGVLDFAVFDADDGEGGGPVALALLCSGRTLAAPLAHPLLAVANYVVDSLRMDAFHVAPGGGLSQVTVALERRGAPRAGGEGGGDDDEEAEDEVVAADAAVAATAAGAGGGGADAAAAAAAALVAARAARAARAAAAAAADSDALRKVQVRWARAPLPAAAALAGAGGSSGPPPPPPHPDAVDTAALEEPYRSSTLLSAMLRGYGLSASRLRERGGVVLLPLGGFSLLAKLRELAGGRLLAIVGDKGHSTLEEMAAAGGAAAPSVAGGGGGSGAPGADVPHIALHGSISLMVNFHALRTWARAHGGAVVCSPYAEGFKVAAFFFDGPPPSLGGGGGGSGGCPGVASGGGGGSDGCPASSAAAAEAAAAVAAADAMEAYAVGGVDALAVGRGAPALAGAPLPWYPLAAFGVNGLAGAQAVTAEPVNGVPANPLRFGVASYEPAAGGFLPDDEVLEPVGGPSGVCCVGGAWARARAAAAEALGGTGMGPDDFALLQRGVHDECASPSVALALSLLRLSNHDSDVFLKFRGVMQAATEPPEGHGVGAAAAGPPPPVLPANADPMLRDLAGDVDRVFSAYYPLQPGKDVCFELARLLMNVRDYAPALKNFARSRAFCGDHHVTAHNEGLCYVALGDLPAAAAAFRDCLAKAPEYEDARNMLARVEMEMKVRGSNS